MQHQQHRYVPQLSSIPIRTIERGAEQLTKYPYNVQHNQPMDTHSYLSDEANAHHNFVNMFAPGHHPSLPLTRQGNGATSSRDWHKSVLSWQSNVDQTIAPPSYENYTSSQTIGSGMAGMTSQSMAEVQHHQHNSNSSDQSNSTVPSQEAWSFTWDSKGENRNLAERVKPKRRKLTASERARTKALKLAGGACEICRKKKKKCHHKDLTEHMEEDVMDEVHSNEDQSIIMAQDAESVVGEFKTETQMYGFPTSNPSPYLSHNDDMTPTLLPDENPAHSAMPRGFLDDPYHTLSSASSEEFVMDTAGFGHQFNASHPMTLENMYVENANGEYGVPWYPPAVGYRGPMYQPY
ncbi:hypothetical protein BGW36DRAFT_430040 [Talaromyces proteolyticus]|uniref:Uncharacterized protein n=1 Tax=Talaromyces proteolyticus TaxID=1131652 RepID=A0AAD4KL07_9EURO|nr:uncharacterized protein BGW36DRAFT_430040 [Talaromyces proteolyticus]KAH8694017.1 hypothetical protein BGW36DRAFT_430040 [Talaromyces proteolyticus]